MTHTVVTKAFVAAGRTLLIIWLARSLPLPAFGAYNLIASMIAIGLGFAGLDASAYIYRAVPGASEREARMVFTSVAAVELGVASSLLVGGVALGGLDALAKLNGAEAFRSAFVLAGLILLLELLAQELSLYNSARFRIETANIIEALKQAAWIPLAVVAGFLVRPDLELILFLNIVGLAIAIVHGFRRIARAAGEWPRPDRAIILAALRFSIPLIGPALSFQALKFADRFILAALRSLSDVAVYGLAASLANLVYTFSSLAIANTLVPRAIAAHNAGDVVVRDRILWRTLKYGLWAFVLAGAALWAGRQLVLDLIGRPGYVAAMDVFPWIAVGYLFILIATPATYRLYVADRTRTLFIIETTGAVLAIGLDVLLIPPYGYHGAAIATIMGFGLVCVTKYLAVGPSPEYRPMEILSIRRELALVGRALARRPSDRA